MARGVPGPWVRRPISIGVLITGSLLVPIVTPIALLVAATLDLATQSPRMRRSRIVLLISGLLLVDLAGHLLVFGAWLISPVGINVARKQTQDRYQSIMTWWTSALIKTISAAVPLPFDLSELDESLLSGNAIVISRHRSLFDAVYPGMLLGSQGLTALYTLKEELRWEPNIDIVGHRMRHVFVTRDPSDLEAELEPIRDLAGRIDEQSVAVIFPEGTFFSPERQKRALKAIRARDPQHLNSAERLGYLLPPRPAGTLALLDGAPNADLIMLGHVGFEPFGTLREILGNVGAEHSIVVRVWRFARDTIPLEPAAQIDWLYQRWAEMDDWIASHHPLRGHEDPKAIPPSN